MQNATSLVARKMAQQQGGLTNRYVKWHRVWQSVLANMPSQEATMCREWAGYR